MSLPREWSFVQDVCDGPGGVKEGINGAQPLLSSDEALVSLDVMSSSLLSVQSAPVLEAPVRPQHLPLPQPLTKSNSIQSPPDTNLEEDDNLLTISSLTARPLIAKSKELGRSGHKKRNHRLSRKTIKRNSIQTEDSQPSGIDGGYGWFIVMGAFMVQFWVAGLVKSYGVLYVEVLETFPDSSASVASWIPAILTALCLALAPVSSALCQKYSCRAVVFIGGLFCSAGLACSYFATSLIHLFFTFGILTGIGGGLSTTPGIVIVSQYFDKHRALANGICVSGTAAGSFVFPMIIESLVNRYGFHGTILLLGGGMLHVCVSAALYRPPPGEETLPPDEQQQTSAATSITEVADSNQISFNTPSKTNEKMNNRLESLFMSERMNDVDAFLNHKNATMNADFTLGSLHKIPCTGSDLSLKMSSPRNNLICEIFHPSLIEVTKPIQHNSDSEESSECKDVMGVGNRWVDGRLRLRATRSSSLLHSVEDLTTDSTCVYKGRHRLFTRSMYIKPPPVPAITIPDKIFTDDEKKVDKLETSEQIITIEPDDVDKKVTCVDRIARYLDVSLLKDCKFMLLSGSVTLMSTGSPYMLYYLPAHTLSIGHTKPEAGSLVAISAVLDLIGRLTFGWLCDLQLFDRKKAYLVSVFVAGLSVLSLPLIKSWWLMAFASGCYGLCLGCWFLLVPVLLTDLFGTDRISSSYGLVRMFQSIGAISIPPLAGYMKDVTGGYSLCFYGMGSCMVLSALPMFAVSSKIIRSNHNH